jgi:1,2-dihydroxy-3-keto-5-methylthiopentene dioxygenase
MTVLRIYADHAAQAPLLTTSNKAEAARELSAAGVLFEQWQTDHPLPPGATQEQVLAAYAAEIERLKQRGGYVTVDVVSMAPEHPQKAELRQKFLSEHRHAEDEVRFFVSGRGLFTLHLGERVYEICCTEGDLVSVPRGTPHWFDMGSSPEFVAIRLFNQPEGWVAHYTGSDIAERFSRLDAWVGSPADQRAATNAE